MIAAGTGILPFIDLLDLLFKKALYLSLKSEGKDTSKIKPEQDYENLFKGAKFRLFCAFRTLEDFVGWEWIGKIAQISKKLRINLFDCIVRIKVNEELPGVEVVKDYFNKDFYEKRIGNKFDKLWVCGPPKMHVDIQNDFVAMGVKPDKIFYV